MHLKFYIEKLEIVIFREWNLLFENGKKYVKIQVVLWEIFKKLTSEPPPPVALTA